MKVFCKEKKSNGRRHIYCCGVKVLSYKRKKIAHSAEAAYSPYADYKEKFEKAGWLLEKKENKYFLSNDKLTVSGDADNTLWTGYSVFCRDEYSFFDKEPYIVIDIGLNLGFTSLRLATEDYVVKVYGFEPFTPTYKLAVDNLNKNPKYARKIEIFNFGLSDKDGSLDIHYNPDLPGSMSTIKDRFEDAEAVEVVQLKKASTVLEPILAKHTEKVFVKIDCEGAEKEIIPELAKSGILKKVSLINMEWHFENPQKLIDILKNEGFVVVCHHDNFDELGMIIAFKK